MARSIQENQQIIIDQKNAESELDDLNSPSQVAIWNLWTFIVAVAINLFEQILDVAKLDLEQIARDAIAGTAEWLQKRVLEFQYDADNPQVITVIDGRASYPTLDESLRIVTRAAVKAQENGRVLVKAAKGDAVIEPLSTVELNALKGYLKEIGFVGIPLDAISLFSDRFRFEGSIFYSGEFVETDVKENVIIAITDYLSSISIDTFDGVIVREKVIDAIQAVAGVEGIDSINVIMNARPEQSAFGGVDNVLIQRTYETAAGYVIEEDETGQTFDDTITMILN